MGCRVSGPPQQAHCGGDCDQLTQLRAKIPPATYYEHRGRGPTARQQRDEELKPKIAKVHADDYGVYGARKVWLTLNRERPEDAEPIARCTIERLMGELGLAGAVRGKVKQTTLSDPRTPKPGDLVGRNFRPLAPDQLWVADFTYVSTWSDGFYGRIRNSSRGWEQSTAKVCSCDVAG